MADDVNTVKGKSLFLDFLLDGSEVVSPQVNGNEDDLRVNAVLRLGKEVCSDEGGIGGVVCNDLNGMSKSKL